MQSAQGERDERGETLIELVVAIAILGIGAVAVLAGLMLSVKASDQNRRQATGGAYVRSFAEAIQNNVDANGYRACGSAIAGYSAVTVPDLPAGYTATVTAVQSWTGSAWGACTANGIQRVDLKVTSSGDAKHKVDETLTVILRQPCNGVATASTSDPCA
ncbi:prepilin-type cleavage/methylation domain-containing protein [Nocardioides aromaticivorans]|uniref:Prepilin-type cleavage/methylation domain-containing protein n=1 Tax=Nocardioides aromaticivorans TaxID=200618 RepID=A0ABX7PIL6_9ACTN|nr:type II secretion system protein [Nocardioides aromaticivorans]QSR25791.1 prepilin-type cleavage/methylation domain-containing protein [Nocardioides aromaticivorans]